MLLSGLVQTAAAEGPPGSEFLQVPTEEEVDRAAAQLLEENRKAVEVGATVSEEVMGDAETCVAEVRDRYSASDDDPLIDNAEDAVGQATDDESLSETSSP